MTDEASDKAAKLKKPKKSAAKKVTK